MSILATDPSFPVTTAAAVPGRVFVSAYSADSGNVRTSTTSEADARGLLGFSRDGADAGKNLLLWRDGDIVPGFTGLTPGPYYLNASGPVLRSSLSAAAWTRRVGVALSPTHMLLSFGDVERIGADANPDATETYSATTAVLIGDATNNPTVDLPGSGAVTFSGNPTINLGTGVKTIGGTSLISTGVLAWTLKDNDTAGLSIGAAGDTDMMTFITTNAGETVAIGAALGLRLNDSSPLRFGTPGTDLVMTPDGTDVVVTATGDLVFADSVDVYLGTGKDLRLYHDGTDSFINSLLGTGNLRIGLPNTDGTSSFYLEQTGANPLLTVTSDAVWAAYIKDNSGTAWRVIQAGNNYIAIDTTNTTETIAFGNSTTNPIYSFLGSGAATFTGGLNTDTIAERTGASGVTIDGVTLKDDGIQSLSLGDYANDGAAAGGGIAVGQLYRNGSVVMIRVA